MTAEKLFTEWLEKQDFWLKSLFCKLSTKNELTDDDYKEIIDNYIRLHFEPIPINISNATANKVLLKKLYDIKGVNRLVPAQELTFGENLTVIYGENGTGKTGYSRIIQHVGKCLGEKRPIKANVFDETIIPQAKLEYTLDDRPDPFVLQWQESNEQTTLNIKLFNSSCVKFSLNNERKIDFKPYIFYLCEKLALSTIKLNSYVSQRLNDFWECAVNTLEDGSEAREKVVSVLSTNKSGLTSLDEYVAKLDIDELRQLKKDQETKKDELNETALLSQIKLIKDKQTIVNQILDTITKSNAFVDNWNEEYSKNEKEIQEIASKTTVDQILSSLQIDVKLKKSFVAFISATDKLYKLVTSEDASLADMKKCPICRKEISSSDTTTIDLLKQYQELVSANKIHACDHLVKRNQEIQEVYKKIAESLKIIQALPQVIEDKILFGIVEKTILTLSNIVSTSFKIEIEESVSALKEIVSTLDVKAEKLNQSLSSLDEQKKKINENLNDLNAKIYLKENWEKERAYILSYINLIKLKDINNHSISKCQKDIQEKIYKEGFVQTLAQVLARLNAPKEIKFNTAIISSQMAIKQGYDKITKANQLNEILSEGEQTVVALAQFIAESLFNPNDNVLFFDDPVNSLDLGRMQVIAKELVSLAQEKQIVIFTHNLVFLSFLKTAIEKNTKLKKYVFYQTERTLFDGKDYVGKLTETANPNLESYEYYIKKAKETKERSKKEQISIQELKQNYGYIRSAIELLVSLKILKGTTERYKTDISVVRFSKINVDYLKNDQEPLSELYERACRYIDGHSSALEAKVDPSINEFLEDLLELETIGKKYA